jgi:hypothetical protein
MAKNIIPSPLIKIPYNIRIILIMILIKTITIRRNGEKTISLPYFV